MFYGTVVIAALILCPVHDKYLPALFQSLLLQTDNCDSGAICRSLTRALHV